MMTSCRYCGRGIVYEDGRWIDPEATGDDSIWRETCDGHDTFVAEHEPLGRMPQPRAYTVTLDDIARGIAAEGGA